MSETSDRPTFPAWGEWPEVTFGGDFEPYVEHYLDLPDGLHLRDLENAGDLERAAEVGVMDPGVLGEKVPILWGTLAGERWSLVAFAVEKRGISWGDWWDFPFDLPMGRNDPHGGGPYPAGEFYREHDGPVPLALFTNTIPPSPVDLSVEGTGGSLNSGPFGAYAGIASRKVARVMLRVDDGQEREADLIAGPAGVDARFFVLFPPYGPGGTIACYAEDGSTLGEYSFEEDHQAVLRDPERRSAIGVPPLPEPADYCDAQGNPRGTAMLDPRSPGRVSYPARILIVEDDPDIARYLQVGLLTAGHESVEIAGDGLEGLTLALEGRFDLCITDVMHPGIDGIELVRRLRDDPATRDLPVLILTAHALATDMKHGLEAGADDYMIKPFDVLEVLAHVKALLRRKRAVSESGGGDR